MLPSEIVLQIEEILGKRGIKKAEFYAKTGVSAASFSHWRKNEHVPEMKALKSVNAFLGTNFGIAEIKEKPAPSGGDGRDADFEEMAKAWDNATPEARQAALAVLRLQGRSHEAQG